MANLGPQKARVPYTTNTHSFSDARKAAALEHAPKVTQSIARARAKPVTEPSSLQGSPFYCNETCKEEVLLLLDWMHCLLAAVANQNSRGNFSR